MLEFIETSQFPRLVAEYLSDDEYCRLQEHLNVQPESGELIRESGGVRKLRWALGKRGKRGGLRVIYYLRQSRQQIWLLTLYDKSTISNMPAHVLKAIKETIEDEQDN